MILLIDQDRIWREILQRHLLALNLPIKTYSTGFSAIRDFAKHNLSLVILDVDLPDISGSALLQELRSSPNGNSVPIVVLTNSNDQTFLQESMKYQAQDYILKSQITIPSLISRLNNFVSN